MQRNEASASSDEEYMPLMGEEDMEPYVVEAPQKWSPELETVLKTRAVQLEDGAKKREGDITTYIHLYGLRAPDDAVRQTELALGIDPNKWTVHSTSESIFNFQSEFKRYDVCFEVRVQKARDVPFSSYLWPWTTNSCCNNLRNSPLLMWHGIHDSEVSRLLVLAHAFEMFPEHRDHFLGDPRIAVTKTELIIECFRVQPVKDRLQEGLTDKGWAMLCQEMRNVGWRYNVQDRNKKKLELE